MKITVFFQSKTFSQKNVTVDDSLIYRDKPVSREQLQINTINRISRHLIAKFRVAQDHMAPIRYKDPNYTKRFEILSIEKPPYPWQESEYRWKNRRSSLLT